MSHIDRSENNKNIKQLNETDKPLNDEATYRQKLQTEAIKDTSWGAIKGWADGVESSIRNSVFGKSKLDAVKTLASDGMAATKSAITSGGKNMMATVEKLVANPDHIVKGVAKGVAFDLAYDLGKEHFTPKDLAKKQVANLTELEAAAKRDGFLSGANLSLLAHHVAEFVPGGVQAKDYVDAQKASHDLNIEETIKMKEREVAVTAAPTKKEIDAYLNSDQYKKSKISATAAATNKQEKTEPSQDAQPKAMPAAISSSSLGSFRERQMRTQANPSSSKKLST